MADILPMNFEHIFLNENSHTSNKMSSKYVPLIECYLNHNYNYPDELRVAAFISY